LFLAVASWQGARQQQRAAEGRPAAEQLGVADERGEDVEVGAESAHVVQQALGRLVAVGRTERGDPRVIRNGRHRSVSLADRLEE